MHKRKLLTNKAKNEANIAAIAEKRQHNCGTAKATGNYKRVYTARQLKRDYREPAKEIKSLNERNNFMQEDFNSKTAEKR